MTGKDLADIKTEEAKIDFSKYDSLASKDRPQRDISGKKDKNDEELALDAPVLGIPLEDSVLLGPGLGEDYYRIAAVTDKLGVANQKLVRTLHISEFAIIK